MTTQKIYCGGEFIETTQKLNVTCSYNNEPAGTTYLAGTKELNFAIKKATEAFDEYKSFPSHKRYTALMKIAALMQQNREKLALLICAEACKPLKYALGEVDRAIQAFIVAAEETKRLPKEYISLDWTQAGENKEGLVKNFPMGIIAGIAPFNFPLNLAVHKIAPALASGNAIILKPSRSTPLSILELAKYIDQTELPKGIVSILPMDRESGSQLVTDARFKMLSFTGSPEVGWKMKDMAGKKKVCLELGGNAGVIVTESANMKLAVNKCVAGAFAYSGQVCIHTQRIYVQESIFEKFITEFIHKTKELKAGNPNLVETDISSMIDEENAIRVESWIQEAVKSGAKIVSGGTRIGSLVEPTVLTQTKSEMKVCSCEVFGPVVTIEKYNRFAEAIEMINDSEFGLQAGVFTNNLSEEKLAFEKIETGGVIINDVPTFRVDHMPYGGIKNSGFGREGIRYAIMEMMEPKILVR